MDNKKIAQSLFEIANAQLRSSVKVIENFRDELAKDASYAFEWGEHAMICAARIKAWNAVKLLASAVLNDQPAVSFEGYIDRMRDDVLWHAKSTASSTSQLSNIMAVKMNAARAEVVETLKQVLNEYP